MNPFHFQNRQNQQNNLKVKNVQIPDQREIKFGKDSNLENIVEVNYDDNDQNRKNPPKLMKYQITKPNEYEEWQTITQLQHNYFPPEQYNRFSNENKDFIKIKENQSYYNEPAKNSSPFQIHHTEIPQNYSNYSNFIHENDSIAHTLQDENHFQKKYPLKMDNSSLKSDSKSTLIQKEKKISNENDPNFNQDPDKILEHAIQGFRQKNINITETVKELEKENAIKILTERLLSSIAEKEDLQNTIQNLNSLLAGINKKYEDRELKLLSEIESLKEYAARFSEDRFHALEEENKNLREEVERQKKSYFEMENQFRQENQELMHLYIDAEETKKHILDQLVQIKQSRDKIIQERKEIESEKVDLIRLKSALHRENQEKEINLSNSFSRENRQSEYLNKEKYENNSLRKKLASQESQDDVYANAINTRLQQLTKPEDDDKNDSSREEENSNIAKLRQVIANLQNFDA